MCISQNYLYNCIVCCTVLAFAGKITTINAARWARSESRIVDGVNVTPLNKYPMMVSIGSGGNPKFGGTIWNKYYILTSGECAEFVQENLGDAYVQAGVYYVGDPDPRYLQTVAAKSVTIHPRLYDESKGKWSNDIGVIRLSHPLIWNDYVAPTNIPEPGWTPMAYDDIKAIAAGWGLGRNRTYPYHPTRPLQETQLALYTTDICQHKTSMAFNDDQLCTEYGDAAGVCIDDFGGPLFVYHEEADKHIQIGITSVSYEFCGNSSNTGYKSINPRYTKVSSFFHWINEAVRECSSPRNI